MAWPRGDGEASSKDISRKSSIKSDSIRGEKGSFLLSAREIECLLLASAGKSEWEISRILGISEHTSEKHLMSAKTKLGAVNRVQAVAEALRRGYIT